MTQDARARSLGVAYRVTFQRGRPARAQVRLDNPHGLVIAETVAVPGEHPIGPLVRALDHAERALPVIRSQARRLTGWTSQAGSNVGVAS